MIRHAVEDDIPALVMWAESLFQRAGWPTSITCDGPSMSATLGTMITEPDKAVFVHDHGFAGAIVFPAYFNHALRFGKKVWWYAEPGHLRKAHAALFDAMEDWARMCGATWFFANATDAMGPKAVGRLYERRGYAISEHCYMKDICHGH